MQTIQIEDDSGYTEVANAFLRIVVYDISFCMYRLCSNVEDHSNVDTSNTLSDGRNLAAEGQLVIGIWKRALLVLEIRCAVLGLLCSLRKFQFLLQASHIRSMLAMAHESNPHHRRTSSESLLIEKSSWFDELLDEPETPFRKGAHRRSSSDPFAYIDVGNVVSNIVESSGSAQSLQKEDGIPSLAS